MTSSLKLFLILYYIKQQLGIYLLNRRHQNVLVTKRVAQEAQLNVSLMFLPHFEVFVFHMMKEQNVVNDDVIYASILQQIISKNQSNCVCYSAYHIITYCDLCDLQFNAHTCYVCGHISKCTNVYHHLKIQDVKSKTRQLGYNS